MKATKFTFKTNKPTGKYHSFFETFHYIKLNGLQVGSIDDKAPHKIRLMVILEDGNPNCDWKWIKLKHESVSLQDAKDWVNVNFDKILNLNLKQS